MARMRKEKEKKIDGTLLVTVWILLGLGLVILYSASAYNGRVRFHDPAYYFKKQLFASALGVIGMYAVAKIDYRRLFELADSITEIKTICDCGRKATTNARIGADGYVVTEGDQVLLGGNDSYIAMCHKCYQDYILQHRKVELLHGSERDLT